jgi:hypothetical protein
MMKKVGVFKMIASLLTITGCESDKENGIDLNDKNIAVTDVRLSLNALTLEVGEKKNLAYYISPGDATNQEVIWNSSHPEIANVNSNGVLETQNTGDCVITVTTKDGNREAYCHVKVISRGGIVDLKIEDVTAIKSGETVYNSQYDISLRVVSINDGRCPIGVDCMRLEGTSEAFVEFQLTTQKDKYNFILHTFQGASFPNDTVIEGLKYELLNIWPYPVPFEEHVQKAIIRVEEDSEKEHKPLEEGVYSGIFSVHYLGDMPDSWGKGTGETTLGLKDGRYACTGNANKIPAGGSGTYSINGNKIIFNDENGWLADFDWNLVLHGEYYYAFDGTKLRLTAIKNNVGLYEFNLDKKNEYGNATVLGKSLDCGDIFLIRFDADVTGLPFPFLVFNNTYLAMYLPEEYKTEGKRIQVEFRLPDKDDEPITCTAMGPAYPVIYIVSVQ